MCVLSNKRAASQLGEVERKSNTKTQQAGSATTAKARKRQCVHMQAAAPRGHQIDSNCLNTPRSDTTSTTSETSVAAPRNLHPPPPLEGIQAALTGCTMAEKQALHLEVRQKMEPLFEAAIEAVLAQMFAVFRLAGCKQAQLEQLRDGMVCSLSVVTLAVCLSNCSASLVVLSSLHTVVLAALSLQSSLRCFL